MYVVADRNIWAFRYPQESLISEKSSLQRGLSSEWHSRLLGSSVQQYTVSNWKMSSEQHDYALIYCFLIDIFSLKGYSCFLQRLVWSLEPAKLSS